MANLGLDLSEFSTEQPSFQPLPAGEYRFKVSRMEMKDWNGVSYLNAMYEVTSNNQYYGQKVFDSFFIYSEYAKSAKRKLYKLATACGLPNPQYISDSSEFEGYEFMGRVEINEKGKNVVKEYFEVPQTTTQQPQQPQPQQAFPSMDDVPF